MTQVFISYSRKDLEFVDRLANDLKATGFEVWYDLSGLEPGTRWRQEIQKAIQESQFFLVVLSPNSIISDWVEREFLYASDQKLKIIPILYLPCKLPMWSLNLHFIDMQGKNYALHYQDLLKVMGVTSGSEAENPIAIRYIEIGDEYRKRGQAAQAIESYQQALRVDPDSLKAHINIGAVHLSEQAFAEAAAAYELALQISNANLVVRAGWCDANMALGNQARAEGRLDEAIHFYLEILRVVPGDVDASQSLANIHTSRAAKLLADGQEEEALAAFTEAIKYSPDDPGLASTLEKLQAKKKTRVQNELTARAEAGISSGNWDQALAALQEALQNAPQDAFLLQKFASVKTRQQQEQLDALLSKVDQAEKALRWDEALSGLNEYLQIKPDDKVIRKRMEDLMRSKHAAWLATVTQRVDQFLANREWEAALAALNEALQLEPENKAFLTRADQVQKDQKAAKLNANLGRAEQAAVAGRWEDAVGILNNGLASDPDNPTLMAKLGETLQARRKLQLQSALDQADAAVRTGKWEEALTQINEVLAEEPDNAEFLEKYNHTLKLERSGRLNNLRTRAKDLLKEEKFEEALAAWNEILLLAPEDRQTVMTEIEAINKAQKLEAQYSQGLQAFEAKDYQKAVDLLNQVLQEQPGYKDAARWLAKARKLDHRLQKKKRSVSRKGWLIGALLAVLLIGIGSTILWFVKNGLPANPDANLTLTASPENNYIQKTPDPKATNPANQHRYQFFINPFFWHDARDDCIERGGYLATIQDEAENQFVYNLISTQATWLGATDENEEGNWAWVTGEPWMYMNWAEGQPDNDLTDDSLGENYLSLLWPEWNDVPNENRPYVCEWEPSLSLRQTITVTSPEDSGPGTLRQALLDAHSGDLINFDADIFPPEDPVAINLYSALPVLDLGHLTVDASNAGVVLNGSHAGGDWTPGIDIWSDHNTIKGLGIIGYSGPGIALQANASFNTIGGDRNVGLGQIGEGNFVGANSDGIAIWGSDNIVTGNLVGIVSLGSEDWNVGNKASGIFIEDEASRNTIGPDNIIAYNGTVGGCGIEFTSLDAQDNNLTANIIYTVKLKNPGICYNINPGGRFVYSTPPVILYADLENGTAAGQACPDCRVEIFSTNTQDAKTFEGAVTADEFGNFVFRKSGELSGPFLTATSRSSGENTSEISLPTPERTDLMIALDAAWLQKPVFETSFNTWDGWIPEKNSSLVDGKLILSSENENNAFASLDLFRYEKFIFEFEMLILDTRSAGQCGFDATGDGNADLLQGLTATFSTDGQAILSHFVSRDQSVIIATGSYEATKLNKVKLVILGEQIAVFINGQLTYLGVNPDGTLLYSNQALSTKHAISCEFDNYKLWDLSKVELNP